MSNDFGNLDAAIEAQKAQQQAWASGGELDAYRHELRLIAGEVVTVRPVGGSGEPHTYNVHQLSPIAGREFGDRLVCLGPSLVCCQKANAGRAARDTRIKQASGQAAMTVYSNRIVFLVPQQKQTGEVYYRQEPYRVNATGQPIYKDPQTKQTLMYPGGAHPLATGQYQWQEEGLKVWVGSTGDKAQNMARIFAMAQEFKGRCKCGRSVGSVGITAVAAIHAVALTCANCGCAFPADPLGKVVKITCHTCGHAAAPEETLACTANCGNPQRGSLTSCYLKISRVGQDKTTSYTFEALPFSDPDPKHAPHLRKPDGSPNCLDLAKIYAPSPKLMMEGLAARGFNVTAADVVHPGGTAAPMVPGQGFFPGMPVPPPGMFVPPGAPSTAPKGFPGFQGIPGTPAAIPSGWPPVAPASPVPAGTPGQIPNFFTAPQSGPPGIFQPPPVVPFKNLG